jgi:hypothetical protein
MLEPELRRDAALADIYAHRMPLFPVWPAWRARHPHDLALLRTMSNTMGSSS